MLGDLPPRSRNRPQMDGIIARQQMDQQGEEEVWPKFVIIIIIIGA